MQTANIENTRRAFLNSIAEFRSTIKTSKRLADDINKFLDKLSSGVSEFSLSEEDGISEKLRELANILHLRLRSDTAEGKSEENAEEFRGQAEKIITLQKASTEHEKKEGELEKSLLDARVGLAEIIELYILERPDAELRRKLQALVDAIKQNSGDVSELDLKIRTTSA